MLAALPWCALMMRMAVARHRLTDFSLNWLMCAADISAGAGGGGNIGARTGHRTKSPARKLFNFPFALQAQREFCQRPPPLMAQVHLYGNLAERHRALRLRQKIDQLLGAYLIAFGDSHVGAV